MIPINELVVTQNGFRNSQQITGMIEFVASGGIFDRDTLDKFSSGAGDRPINVVRFEDGRLFIHDGHHRVAAIYLGGRDTLDPSEYVIKEWKYSDFSEVNLKVGWVTPYDPRSYIRVADYKEYKRMVEGMIDSGLIDNAMRYIELCKSLGEYAKPRTVLTIKDLLRYI